MTAKPPICQHHRGPSLVSLIKLLSTDYQVTEEVMNAISSLPIASDESFAFANPYIALKPAERLIHEVRLQNRSAREGGKAIAGYASLKKQLLQLQPSAVVQLRFVESETWQGCVFASSSKLMGVLLGKKPLKPMKTPPGWDGTLKMLEAYNKA